MSHEVRTPSNAVLSYADLLEMGIAGPLTKAEHDYLNPIQTRQHWRLEWSKEALQRDYQILREEVEIAPQSAGDIVTGEAVAEAASVIQRLLSHTEEISLAAYQAAQSGL